MDDGDRLMRAAQGFSEMVQDRTGWTCYRQAALLAGLDAVAIAGMVAISASAGTLPVHPANTLAIALGGIASLLVRRVTDAGHWMLAMADAAGMLIEMLCIGGWWLGIPFAATGDMPTDVALALGLGEAGWSVVMLRADRDYLARCARGSTAADRTDDSPLTFDYAICLGLLAAAALHRDLPSLVGLAVAGLFAAAALLARCTPRPPSVRRARQPRLSIGFAGQPA